MVRAKGDRFHKKRPMKKKIRKKSVNDNRQVKFLEKSQSLDAAEDEEELDTSKMVREQNKKKKSGGFQRMGLSFPVLKGILRKGYKVPTPIQRKTIPIIMEGKDVVAMARTGSGKTAAFLIPMFERLKVHCAKSGARALVLSPTRELALQTLKFTKELGRLTGLRAAVILGGDKIEDQFSAIHENPDIIIATPGRFLHVLVEMDLKLSAVEYVVFDEADRIFEMGFQEQLQEILNRLPENRQTLLFSATLPRLLADFAKAGLNDPELIRLDIESNLSENLKTSYLFCRSDEKTAVLLHLLTSVVKENELTVVFLATRHHVDYVRELLVKAGIPFSYVYSSLDQTARKIEVAKFQARKSKVLLVTDVAARGIDIPLLDNVINYNFPAKPKLFVHRVGRVARAGRSGSAYSIISPDESAYVLDLHMFLGRSMLFAHLGMTETDGVIGTVPQRIIDEESDLIRTWHESSVDLKNMAKVCNNAYQQYIKSRPAPSTESVKRMKGLMDLPPTLHPVFQGKNDAMDEKRNTFLASMRSYRPTNTTFEVGATAKNDASKIMRAKKLHHKKIVEKSRHLQSLGAKERDAIHHENAQRSTDRQMASDENENVKVTFRTILKRSSSGSNETNAERQRKKFRDDEYYLPHLSADHHLEKGLEMEKNFDRQVAGEVLDMTGDDATQIRKNKNTVIWDRKKKKFTKDPGVDPKKKKIRTESGVWIPASYKSNLYKKWKDRNKVEQQEKDSDDEDDRGQFGKQRPGMSRRGRNKKGQTNQKGGQPNRRRELKTKEEILKTRERRDKLQFHQKRRQMENAKKRKNLHKRGGKR